MILVQQRVEFPERCAKSAAIVSGLDLAGLAAWAIDPQMSVVASNSTCKAFMPVNFFMQDYRLRAVTDGHQLQLDRILAAALGRFAAPASASAMLTGEDGQRLLAEAHPMNGLDAAAALLLVRPLDINTVPSGTERMRQFFGFTPAECMFAAHLLTGVPIATIALTMKISVLTARECLKTLFHKTGTRRQAELVLLLERLHR